MDIELQERWRAARPPFDGVTLAADEGMPLSAVRAILTRVLPPPKPTGRMCVCTRCRVAHLARTTHLTGDGPPIIGGR